MKRRRILIPILLVTAATIAFALSRRRGSDAGPDEFGKLYGAGTIETTEIEVAATVGGRILAVPLREGARVQAGDVLVRLDARELETRKAQAAAAVEAAKATLDRLTNGTREEQLRAARAAVEVARKAEQAAAAKLELLRNGARPAEKRQAGAVVSQAEASLSGAKAALTTAKENYDRVTQLKQQLDAAESAQEAAVAQQKQADAQLRLVREGARQEQLDRAKAGVDQAKAAQKNAKRRYDRVTELFGDGAAPRQTLDDAEAALESADAAVDTATAQLAELKAGSRTEEIRRAEAALEQANAGVAGAAKALANAQVLYADRLDARGKVEAAETQVRVAQEQRRQAEEAASLVNEGPRREEIRAAAALWEQAKAQTRAAKAQLDLLVNGERPEVIEAAAAELKRAEGLVKQLDTTLEDSVVLAPQDGTLAEVVAEPGEVVSPGSPILRLYSLRDVWLKVYLPLKRLGYVKVGQKASVVSDTFPKRQFAARVIEVAEEAEFTPKNVQTKEQRVQQVFWVKLGIENQNGELKPGMPAEGWIETGEVE
jgi:multidrug resistance efflux pump